MSNAPSVRCRQFGAAREQREELRDRTGRVRRRRVRLRWTSSLVSRKTVELRFDRVDAIERGVRGRHEARVAAVERDLEAAGHGAALNADPVAVGLERERGVGRRVRASAGAARSGADATDGSEGRCAMSGERTAGRPSMSRDHI